MKLLNKIKLLIKLGRNTLNESGLLVFLKEGGLFLATFLFRYRKFIIYEKDLGCLKPLDTLYSRLPNMELIIISNLGQLEKLLKDGYEFSVYPNIKMDKDWLKHGALLFCMFLNKKMNHKSWVAMSREAALAIAPYYKRLEYSDEAVIEETATDPDFSGMGICQYVYSAIFHYVHNTGKAKVRLSCAKRNTIMRHIQEKLGSKVIYSGYKVRILYFWDYYSLRLV